MSISCNLYFYFIWLDEKLITPDFTLNIELSIVIVYFFFNIYYKDNRLRWLCDGRLDTGFFTKLEHRHLNSKFKKFEIQKCFLKQIYSCSRPWAITRKTIALKKWWRRAKFKLGKIVFRKIASTEKKNNLLFSQVNTHYNIYYVFTSENNVVSILI